MDFIQIIGFIISLMALFYLQTKQESKEKNSPTPPQPHESEQSPHSFDDTLHSIEKKVVKYERKRPFPPSNMEHPFKQSSPTKKDFLHTDNQNHALKNSLENRSLPLSLVELHPSSSLSRVTAPRLIHPPDQDNDAGPSKAQMAVKRLTHRRDLLIYQEIIDKPKSLRPLL